MRSTHGPVAGVSLRELFPSSRVFGARDVVARNCCSDSRKCGPGDVFVAVLGATHDGHDFVADAVARGAVAVIAERYLPTEVPVCVVPDTREALGQLCQALAGDPTHDLITVGVAGDWGKTCVSLLIGSMLEAAERSVSVQAPLVPPEDGSDPLVRSGELAQWLHRSAVRGSTHAIMEINSRSLAARRLAGIELDLAVLTNLGRAHLDWHGTVRNYREAQRRILEYVKPHGVLVVNADDRGWSQAVQQVDAPRLTYGLKNSADVTARLLERELAEQTFLLMAGDEAVPVRTRIPGDAHLSNCLAAATAGLLMGLDLPQIARGLERLDKIPGRMERLECGQPFGVFVDKASTPETLAGTLNALRRVTPGRLFCVFGAEGDRYAQDRPLLGRTIERVATQAVLTSNNPREEPPLRIIHDLLDGFSKTSRARVIPDREKAIRWALEQAQPGDTVLIAGKGCEPVQWIGQRGRKWDDRELACRWLYESPSCEPELLPFPGTRQRERS